MAETTTDVDFKHDGKDYRGTLALPEGSGMKPGVLVCHAWGGRKQHEIDAASRIARMGFAAMAGDVYGAGVTGETIEENQKLMNPLVEDREELQARLRANLKTLGDRTEVDAGKLVVMGFCFGGLCALDLARDNAPVLGAAAFHAVIGQPGKPRGDDIKAKVIAFQGAEDPMADDDARRNFEKEMSDRNADWQLHTYGGVSHAFTNPDADNEDMGLIYNRRATERAWAGFGQFLSELF